MKKIIPLILIGVALASWFYFDKPEPIEPLRTLTDVLGAEGTIKQIGTRNINYKYSDDNSDETLIIRSDSDVYSGLGRYVINFSVENISGQGQNIKLSVPLVENKIRKVVSIKRFVSNETIFTATSTDIIPATASTTEREVTIPAKIEVNPVWLDLNSSKTTFSVANKKSTADRVADNYYTNYIKVGETLYYELILDSGSAKIDNEEFFIEVFGSKDAYGLLDPILTIDKFNSDTKSTGDLNGQDGWTAAANFDVQDSVTQADGGSGTPQAIISAGIVGDSEASLSVTARTSGIFSVYMQRGNDNAAGNDMWFGVYEGATQRARLKMNVGGGQNFFFNGAWGSIDVGDWLPDTWYHIQIEIDPAGNQVRVQINSETPSAWKSVTFTEINEVRFAAYVDTTAENYYWDNLNYDDGIVIAIIPPVESDVTLFGF